MRLIYFKENQKEIWNEFIAENNSDSFLQSWQWGEFQQITGKETYRIGIKENNEIIALAFFIKNKFPFGRNYLYCPRGPVIKKSKIKNLAYWQAGQKSKILDLLFSEIRKVAKKEKNLFLRIDPPMEWKTENGKRKMENIFLKKSHSEVQPRNTLILDLTKSEEELLKEMKQKTRYNIRLAEKRGVEVISSLNYKKYFPNFWNLIKETSSRDKFVSHRKNYYLKMLECLCRENKDGLYAKLYVAKYKDKIIAANIVLYFGNLCVYLHGASSNEHRNFMAPYLLQWNQIKDAKTKGCEKYDFWGIDNSSKFKVQSSKLFFRKKDWSGITRFKKGFGGYEKKYIGAYDIVFDDIGYTIYGIIKAITKFKNKYFNIRKNIV